MPNSTSRRTFFAQSAGLAAGAALGVAACRPPMARAFMKEEQRVSDAAPIPIVDTHQHLWDLSKFNLPWTKGDKVLERSFVMEDYLRAAEGLGVVKTVYMEVDVHPSQQVQEANYVIGLCRRKDNPMVAAVISGRPSSDAFEDYILKFKESPFIKGVRQVLHGEETPRGYCLDKQFVRSVQLLGDLGMSFDLCMRPEELADAEKLVAQCPRTRFIVDHCGNLSVQETDPRNRKVWQEGMKALAQHDRVVCKISGIVASAREGWKAADLEPNVRFSIETFGLARSMFASDWPVCTLRASYRQWVEALREIAGSMGLSAPEQRRLFHDNAVRFYGLKDKPA
jgi:predicted TIM-barrel fold metal-dependent hydrolase